MILKRKFLSNFWTCSFCVLFLFSCKNDDPDPIDDGPMDNFLGEVEYIKTFGGSGEDEILSVVQAEDGGYVLFGTTKSIDGDITDKTTTDRDYWVLKLNEEGEKLWSKTYGGDADDKGAKITKTSDGGYVLAGYSRSDNGDVPGNEGFHDYWILKIDSGGVIDWSKNYGFSGSDQAFHVFETSDGNYFVTGFLDVTASGGAGNDGRAVAHGVGEYWAILMDSNGERIWRRYFGGSSNDRSYAALEADDGGFLMIGASESDDFDIEDDKGSYDYWVVRLDKSGNKLWTKSFGGSEIDVGYSVTKTTDGNYIIAGDTRSMDKDVSNFFGNADAWLVKFSDSDGSIIWEKSFGGMEFDSARSISPLTEGGYVLAAYSRSQDGDTSTNNGSNDAWIYTIDESGNILFETSIGGSGLDLGEQAIETFDGALILVGSTESNDLDIPLNQGSKDCIIVKIK